MDVYLFIKIVGALFLWVAAGITFFWHSETLEEADVQDILLWPIHMFSAIIITFMMYVQMKTSKGDDDDNYVG